MSTSQATSPTTSVGAQPGVKAGFHIPSLDGIRAIAVIMVLAGHCGYAFMSGALAVNFFFFLSGFLITTLLRREQGKTGKNDWKSFYQRRALRILPPMYVALIFAWVIGLVGLLPYHSTPISLLAQFLGLTNYYHIAQCGSRVEGCGETLIAGTVVMWSLSVENHFYMLYPALFARISKMRMRNAAIVVVGICLAILAWRCQVVWSSPVKIWSESTHAYESTDTRIDGILWGAALALFANPFFEPERAKVIGKWWLGLLCFVGLLASQVYHGPWYWHTFRYTVQSLLLMPIFMLAITKHDRPLFKWLNHPWVVWVGAVSYSFYLLHLPVVKLLELHAKLSGLRLFFVALVLTLVLCVIVERTVEKPIANYRKRLRA